MDDGVLTDNVEFLRADEETGRVMAPIDVELDANNKILSKRVLARKDGDNLEVPPTEVDYVDVSPKQIIGVSAALIPFLEHDDANRALMGSNMQRQAVPLLIPEVPIVGTGMEKAVAENSNMPIFAKRGGVVEYVDSRVIIVGDDEYHQQKFRGMNERTTQNHRPVVQVGDEVNEGELLADRKSVV